MSPSRVNTLKHIVTRHTRYRFFLADTTPLAPHLHTWGQRRHSTIEVPPDFSEAPHSRSPIPHPKTDLSKNQIASRRIIPWPESYKTFFFGIKIEIPTIWGRGTPSFGYKIAEMCYLYRRTGQSTLIISSLPPKRDCGLKRVKQRHEPPGALTITPNSHTSKHFDNV